MPSSVIGSMQQLTKYDVGWVRLDVESGLNFGVESGGLA